MSLSHTIRNSLNSYFRRTGISTAALFTIAVIILSMQMINAQELNQGRQSSELQDEQFLFVGDVFHATFLQPNNTHMEWSDQQWSEEMSRLRQLGTRSLIIQWSKYDDVTFFAEDNQQDSLLHRVTRAAADNDLNFYIGLAGNSDWSNPQHLGSVQIDAALEENSRVAQVIHQQFGQHPDFHGWYIPQELTDVFYTEDQQTLILALFSNLSELLHELSPLKPVLASGYTSPAKSHLVKFTMWWLRVFDHSGIDTLLFQDGAGTSDQDDWKSVQPYLEAISIIDDNYFSGDVWFIAEIFTQVDGTGINEKPFHADSANFERVWQQLEMLGHFGKKIVSYAYFPYMRPTHNESAIRLYEKYKEFVKQRATLNRSAVVGKPDFHARDIAIDSYFELGEPYPILGEAQTWETSAPHTLSVVEKKSGDYKYLGYYGLQNDGGGVGLARSKDLLNWEKDAENPLLENARWPSVIKVDNRFLMMVTRDYASSSHITLFSSHDGLKFSWVEDIVLPESGLQNQNPNLFYDTGNGQYYLYWFSGGGHSGRYSIRARHADSPEGLAGTESETVLLEAPYVMAAPNIFHHDRHYYLSTEVLQGVWKTRIYKGDSPLGPFKLLKDNPILDNGAACFFQHKFGDRLHAYYCKLSEGIWTMAYRSASLG